MSELAAHDQKLSMASAWNESAEAYVANFDEKKAGDETSPKLDMSVGRKLVVARVISALENKATPTVLDVAAAGGEPALSIAKEIPHATVYGTDFAPAMVEIIRKRGVKAGVSNLKAGVEDGETLSGVENGSIDAVTCTWGLESMPDGKKTISQFYRVLKDGGVAVITAWDKDPNSIALKMFRVMSSLNGSGDAPFDIQPFGGGDGVKAMQDAGFVDVTATEIDIPMYVPPGLGLRDVFPYMVRPTPINVALSSMEAQGRTNVREEACALFESQVLKDIADGHAPTGPGLSAAPGPAFCMKAVLFQGRK